MATWALFLGLAFLMVSAGLFATLLGVRAEQVGLSTVLSGAISASYYVGFLAGSKVTLQSLDRVGHIRVYSALASTLAAAMICVGLTYSPIGWMGLRFATGMCLAGLYVVAESWLNDLATNETRGRLLGIYVVITSATFAGGQLMLPLFDPTASAGYAVVGVLTALAVVPVSLSESSAPPMIKDSERISLRELARVVPTGVGSCFLVGIAHGALGGMAAIYATRAGLSPARIGLFVAAPQIGGVVFQWPASMASDDIDRRAVGALASMTSVLAGLMLLAVPADSQAALGLMFLLGGASYPLYSIAAAYTNDWVDPEHINAAASQLIALYGIGAIMGPFTAAGLLVVLGPHGFFWQTIAVHTMLAAFFAYRMKVWRAPLAKRPWSEVSLPARVFYVPATVVAFGRRARRR